MDRLSPALRPTAPLLSPAISHPLSTPPTESPALSRDSSSTEYAPPLTPADSQRSFSTHILHNDTPSPSSARDPFNHVTPRSAVPSSSISASASIRSASQSTSIPSFSLPKAPHNMSIDDVSNALLTWSKAQNSDSSVSVPASLAALLIQSFSRELEIADNAISHVEKQSIALEQLFRDEWQANNNESLDTDHRMQRLLLHAKSSPSPAETTRASHILRPKKPSVEPAALSVPAQSGIWTISFRDSSHTGTPVSVSSPVTPSENITAVINSPTLNPTGLDHDLEEAMSDNAFSIQPENQLLSISPPLSPSNTESNSGLPVPDSSTISQDQPTRSRHSSLSSRLLSFATGPSSPNSTRRFSLSSNNIESDSDAITSTPTAASRRILPSTIISTFNSAVAQSPTPTITHASAESSTIPASPVRARSKTEGTLSNIPVSLPDIGQKNGSSSGSWWPSWKKPKKRPSPVVVPTTSLKDGVEQGSDATERESNKSFEEQRTTTNTNFASPSSRQMEQESQPHANSIEDISHTPCSSLRPKKSPIVPESKGHPPQISSDDSEETPTCTNSSSSIADQIGNSPANTPNEKSTGDISADPTNTSTSPFKSSRNVRTFRKTRSGLLAQNSLNNNNNGVINIEHQDGTAPSPQSNNTGKSKGYFGSTFSRAWGNWSGTPSAAPSSSTPSFTHSTVSSSSKLDQPSRSDSISAANPPLPRPSTLRHESTSVEMQDILDPESKPPAFNPKGMQALGLGFSNIGGENSASNNNGMDKDSKWSYISSSQNSSATVCNMVDGAEPLVDRYGFCLDTKAGMGLLKEARRRMKEGRKVVNEEVKENDQEKDSQTKKDKDKDKDENKNEIEIEDPEKEDLTQTLVPGTRLSADTEDNENNMITPTKNDENEKLKDETSTIDESVDDTISTVASEIADESVVSEYLESDADKISISNDSAVTSLNSPAPSPARKMPRSALSATRPPASATISLTLSSSTSILDGQSPVESTNLGNGNGDINKSHFDRNNGVTSYNNNVDDGWQNTPNHQTGQQSFKRLLAQLGDLNETFEKSQMDAWDAFVKKRKFKINATSNSGGGSSSSHHYSSNSLSHHHQSTTNNAAAAVSSTLNPISAVGYNNEGRNDNYYKNAEDEWSENLVGVARMGTNGRKGKDDWHVFKKLVKNGIPPSYRPRIWAECSGATEVREPGLYQDYLSREHVPESMQCLNQIELDCHRTFPTNIYFGGDGPGVAKLRRVLLAFSRRRPEIGYCQGMNMVAATLLLTCPTEEDAFWIFSCMIERILPSDYYSAKLLVSQADQRVLEEFIGKILPDIWAHFEEIGIDLPAVTFGWFLSLFCDGLPIQTLLRVWDMFMISGSVVIFRIAVGILKMHSKEILAQDNAASLYVCLRTLATHTYQVDKLFKISFDELKNITSKGIGTLREKYVRQIEEELKGS